MYFPWDFERKSKISDQKSRIKATTNGMATNMGWLLAWAEAPRCATGLNLSNQAARFSGSQPGSLRFLFEGSRK
jgi:hypothetical protein